MGVIPKVSQRKKDLKMNRSVVGGEEDRGESRWRTRMGEARRNEGFSYGNGWARLGSSSWLIKSWKFSKEFGFYPRGQKQIGGLKADFTHSHVSLTSKVLY